jgi:hypothetical protein
MSGLTSMCCSKQSPSGRKLRDMRAFKPLQRFEESNQLLRMCGTGKVPIVLAIWSRGPNSETQRHRPETAWPDDFCLTFKQPIKSKHPTNSRLTSSTPFLASARYLYWEWRCMFQLSRDRKGFLFEARLDSVTKPVCRKAHTENVFVR